MKKKKQKHSREVLGNTNLGERNGNHGYRKSKFFPSQELRNRLIELGVPRNKHDIVQLGEMLPYTILVLDEDIRKDTNYFLILEKTIDKTWNCKYLARREVAIPLLISIGADTEADCRAKILVYLLENKLITK